MVRAPGGGEPDAMAVLRTARLVLEPLVAAHAPAMYEVLRDPELHRWLDHPPPPSAEHLASVYGRLEARRSPDGSERWLNWVVREPAGPPLGFVQSTVERDGTAWIAYVLGRPWWRRGLASEAVAAMLEHLAVAYRATRFLATTEAENAASVRLLERLGFAPASPAEREPHRLTPSERLFVRAAR